MKKICLWSIIFIITFVPYFTSNQRVSSEDYQEDISHNMSIDTEDLEPVEEIEYNVSIILDDCTKYIWENFHGYYTINRISYRHNVINIWVYSNDYRCSWYDLKSIGDHVKQTMPDCFVVVIYNYPNRLLYSVLDYAI